MMHKGGGLVGAKNQNRAAGARFWSMKHWGAMHHIEGTTLGWGTPGLRWWGSPIGRSTRGGWLEPKTKTEPPGLGFGQ